MVLALNGPWEEKINKNFGVFWLKSPPGGCPMPDLALTECLLQIQPWEKPGPPFFGKVPPPERFFLGKKLGFVGPPFSKAPSFGGGF